MDSYRICLFFQCSLLLGDLQLFHAGRISVCMEKKRMVEIFMGRKLLAIDFYSRLEQIIRKQLKIFSSSQWRHT